MSFFEPAGFLALEVESGLAPALDAGADFKAGFALDLACTDDRSAFTIQTTRDGRADRHNQWMDGGDRDAPSLTGVSPPALPGH